MTLLAAKPVVARHASPGKSSFATRQISDLWRAPLTDLPVRDELIRQYIPLSAEMEILEAGPGNGFPAHRLARAVSGLTLLEVSPENAGKLRLRFAGTPNVKVVHEDLCRPGLDQDHASLYDLAIAIEVFELLPDPATALRNMAGMLRPGGSLYMQFPNYQSSQWPTSYQSRPALEEHLRAAGFTAWEIYTLRLSPWSQRLFRWLHEVPLHWYRNRKRAQRPKFSLTYDNSWAFHQGSRFDSLKLPIHLYWAATMLLMRLGGDVFNRVECGDEILGRNLFVVATTGGNEGIER